MCRVQIEALVDHRAAQRRNIKLSKLMIDPEVDRTAARKKVKQRLSSLLRKYITGQVPKARSGRNTFVETSSFGAPLRTSPYETYRMSNPGLARSASSISRHA